MISQSLSIPSPTSVRRRTSLSHRHGQYAIVTDGYADSAVADPEIFSKCIRFFPRRMKTIPSSESQIELHGCCMIIQVLGLVDIFEQYGSEMDSVLERHSRTANGALKTIIRSVHSHGGDIISIQPHKLVCLFSHHNLQGPIIRCAMQAIQCGIQLCETGIRDITLKVAISYGTLNFAIIGGYNGVCKYLTNGSCIDSAGQCLKYSEAQGVSITSDVHNVVAHDVSAAKIGNGCVRVLGLRASTSEEKTRHSWEVISATTSSVGSLLSSNGELLLSYGEICDRDIVSCVPPPIVYASVTDSLESVQGVCTVTSLYMRVDSYISTAYHELTSMQSFLFSMQKCVAECGGFLRQFLIDDAGCVLIGHWGTPAPPYSSHCAKALRCAVMMKNEANRQSHSVSIGITTGRVYCGVVGTEFRSEYIALGKSVNFAVHLMTNATGRVLIDNSTFQRLPLDIASCTYVVSSLLVDDSSEASLIHCYTSSVPPTMYARDICPDSEIIVEGYVRRVLYSALDFSNGTAFLFSDTSICSDYSSESDQDSSVVLTANSPLRTISDSTSNSSQSRASSRARVFIITGVPGSGKTCIANFFIRRLVSRQSMKRDSCYKNTRAGVVYVSLSDVDDSTGSSLQKIFHGIFMWFDKHDHESQKAFLLSMIGGAFPSYSSAGVVLSIFPIIEKILQVDWDWGVSCSEEDKMIFRAYTDYREDKSDFDALAELLCYILSEGIPALCVDNAHFMCLDAWKVITRLCLMEPAATIILTIREREYRKLTASVRLVDTSNNSRYREYGDQTEPFFPGSDTPKPSHVATLSEDVVPLRHAQEYNHLVEVLPCHTLRRLHLKKLSLKTVRKIMCHHFHDEIYECHVKAAAKLTYCNPFLLGKLVQYAKQSFSHDLSSAVFHMKGGNVVSNILERLHPREYAILEAASVIGEQFYIDVLKEIVQPSLCCNLYLGISVLEETGVIIALADGYYGFINAIVHNHVYGKIPESDIGKMHLKAASAIQKCCPTDSPGYSVSLSYHYDKCNDSSYNKLRYRLSCDAARNYLKRLDVVAAMPFLESAYQNVATRSEASSLCTILLESINVTHAEMEASRDGLTPSPKLSGILWQQERMYEALQRRRSAIIGIVDYMKVIFHVSRSPAKVHSADRVVWK